VIDRGPERSLARWQGGHRDEIRPEAKRVVAGFAPHAATTRLVLRSGPSPPSSTGRTGPSGAGAHGAGPSPSHGGDTTSPPAGDRHFIMTFAGNDAAELPAEEPDPDRDGLTVSNIGSLLDADHLPTTNGRMAICRRCGAHTDGAEGRQHVPGVRQLARYSDWLCAESRSRQMARAKALRG